MAILKCVTREPGCCLCLESHDRISEECPGCVVGNDISNNLVTTDLVAGSLGRAFLDEEHKNKRVVQGTCSLHDYMKPKSIVQVTDRIHGTFQGQLSKFSINISYGLRGQMSARSVIEVVKVQDDA